MQARRADRGGEPVRQLLVAAPAAIDFGLGPIALDPAALDLGELAEPALPCGRDAVVGAQLRREAAPGEVGRRDQGQPVGDAAPVERRGVLCPPRLVLDDRAGVAVHQLRRRVQLIPQPQGLRLGQQPAVDDDRPRAVVAADLDQIEAEFPRIGEPQRMVAADQLAAALDPAAGNEAVEGQHPAADPVARLDHGDIVAGGQELVRRGEPGKARADHDDRFADRLCRRAGPAEQQRRAGGEGGSQQLAAGRRIDRPAKPVLQRGEERMPHPRD